MVNSVLKISFKIILWCVGVIFCVALLFIFFLMSAFVIKGGRSTCSSLSGVYQKEKKQEIINKLDIWANKNSLIQYSNDSNHKGWNNRSDKFYQGWFFTDVTWGNERTNISFHFFNEDNDIDKTRHDYHLSVCTSNASKSDSWKIYSKQIYSEIKPFITVKKYALQLAPEVYGYKKTNDGLKRGYDLTSNMFSENFDFEAAINNRANWE